MSCAWKLANSGAERTTRATRTQERQQDRVVVRHDEEVDAGERGAGFQVAERLAQVAVLPAVAHKHLEGKVERA